ncbi:MAG: addiction module toxin, HicA family [Methanocalculus sp. MSAO_Arc2]|uniref:type II toxin-antitoxin system HicA family toxin n=1 Tax=Methanocalculus sp. MSAO_Arc2 TaxID=2293855 RepID=UPI000FF09751|nr:MAG: addiction module toxin, HicA family [Methanocalculus sp. MSAO_Arc2]
MKLPRINGDKVIRTLKKAGFEVVHIRGSHHYLHHAERGFLVTVPVHSGQIVAPKTLQTILSQAGLSPEEFRKLL